MNRRNFILSSAATALYESGVPQSVIRQNSATMDNSPTKNVLSADPLRPQYHLVPQV